MQKAALIVNPKAGGGQELAARLAELTRVLEEHGIKAEAMQTTPAAGSARELAAKAAESCELVIACGGDGTVHGVLQGVAHTGATLGVLPFGTANALARNLGLALDPVIALKQLLRFKARMVPLGEATTENGSRWFTVMAGAGPDGELVHEMTAAAKTRWGRQAYYKEAARLFLSRRFPEFRVEYRKIGSSVWESKAAVAMMASRVPDLGGLFRGLTRTSRLDHPHLHVQLVAAPGYLGLPAWFAYGRTGFGDRNPWLTTLEVEELRCISPDKDLGVSAARPVYAQVDGEAVGTIPLHLRIVADGLLLLMP